ncbi:MarR family winged helix-turn-helix transcriptional regulator [uncultured Jatrophihabitans sp.]|uniref:MarR family winged helix-turn-helix transcriptional regulator n=1 Tax=uncultured Jatrophihabitans sp. TaxID=1610747 RepID=UPI0035CB2FE2
MAPAKDQLALDDHLCFALYAASRAMTARYRPLLDPLGLTYPQYLVMLALWESDEATVTELGDKLLLDSGTLSPLLKRLEAAELVSRRRRADDERSLLIRPTERGWRLRSKAARVPAMIRASLADFDVPAMTGELHDLAGALRAGDL